MLELTLLRPAVEVDAEALERGLDSSEHGRDRVSFLSSQVFDVRALVALLGKLLTPPTRLDGRPKAIHLTTRVVVVVLALDLVARELEQARD